jgi:hypothetical protein
MNKLIQLFLFVLLIIYCYTSGDSECLSSDSNSRRLSSDCSELQTTDDKKFVCFYNEYKGRCEEISFCRADYLGLNLRRLSSSCSDLPTTDDSTFVCVKNTNLNICEEVSLCKASSMGSTTGRRLASDCSDLATKNKNFVCINNGDYCQEVSQCKASSDPTNRRRLASDCSDLKTEDDGIFQCMGVDYCEEVLKTCDRIYFDENSLYLDMTEDVCAEAETSDDKKYECVVGPDKRNCKEQKLNENFIKISKLIGLFGLLLI